MRRCITRQISILVLFVFVVVSISTLVIVCVGRSHPKYSHSTYEIDKIYQSGNVNDVIARSIAYISALDDKEKHGYKFRTGERNQCIFIAYKNLIVAYGSMGDTENMRMYLLRLDSIMYPNDDLHTNVKNDLEICIRSVSALRQPVWLNLNQLIANSNLIMEQIENESMRQP
jgi:hypothetical protein